MARQNQVTREILRLQRHPSGRAGRDIGVDWLVCAGVAPASSRRQTSFYRIYLICTSALVRNTFCHINTIHKNGSRLPA